MSPRLLSFAWLAAVALGPSCLSHYQPSPARWQTHGHEIASPSPAASHSMRTTPVHAAVAGLDAVTAPLPPALVRWRGAVSPVPSAGEASVVTTELVAMWISEARWVRHRDHAAQAHIVARFAKRFSVSLPVAIKIRVWDHARPPRWVRRVTAECTQPAGWPKRFSWQEHAPLCRELYARAEQFLAGEVDDPCQGRAFGWRAPGPALDLALANGRRVVWCGRGMANRYVK